jgi:hypothetical protein
MPQPLARSWLLLGVVAACSDGVVNTPAPTTTQPEPEPPTPVETGETGAPAETEETEGPDETEETEETGAYETGFDVVPPVGGCAPAGVVYGVEGEALTVVAECVGEPAAIDTWSASDLPPGATWDAAAHTLTWTPGLSDAGHYEVPIVAWFEGAPSVGALHVWVADAWSTPGNIPVDPLSYQEEYGLPVVFLNAPPSGFSSSVSRPTTVVYRGHTFDVEAKLRGAASLGYPKNSYTIDFPPKDEFEDEDLDFEKKRKIVLTTTFDDNAYVRHRLCYEIWNRLDSGRHPVQTMHAVVYIDGVYEGLYLLGDHIDGEYWEDQGYREDGNLYKAVNHDANFYIKNPLSAGYEKKAGVPESGPGAFADLEDLVRFVASSSADDFSLEIGTRVELEEFMDWWALVRFTEAGDSAGKNSYLYNDPEAPMWHYAPWDFNHSLGQDWQTLRTAYDSGDEFRGTNNLFNRLLSDPVHGPVMMARWRSHLDGPLHKDALDALVLSWIAEIDPSARRDWAKWESQYRTYGGWSWRRDWTSYDEEVVYVRTWIADRWGWLDGLYPP